MNIYTVKNHEDCIETFIKRNNIEEYEKPLKKYAKLHVLKIYWNSVDDKNYQNHFDYARSATNRSRTNIILEEDKEQEL